VQVDPIKPTLKAPGSKRLNPEEMLSNLAFKFNLRRCIKSFQVWEPDEVGRCRLSL